MPWNWKSDRCRTPMSWGIDVASERPKTAATSSASVGAILAMIIVSCTGAPAALGGKDRSNRDDAREATAPPASAARSVLGRTRGGSGLTRRVRSRAPDSPGVPPSRRQLRTAEEAPLVFADGPTPYSGMNPLLFRSSRTTFGGGRQGASPSFGHSGVEAGAALGVPSGAGS